jgi:hypothetical protein
MEFANAQDNAVTDVGLDEASPSYRAKELQEIKWLRALLHRGLVSRDWGLLGLSVLSSEVRA